MDVKIILSAASLLALATVPHAALAQEVHGMVSLNTSQLFKDGFRLSGDNPTMKTAVTIPVTNGFALEGFVNKEISGTTSDEADTGMSYSFQLDDKTSVRLYTAYDWMRDIPDIIESTVSVTHERATVAATRYTLPHALDGYRLEANYRLNPTDKVTVKAGILHEGGLGLPRDVNAGVADASVELKSNLFLDGRLVLPVNGDPVKAAMSLRFAF